MRLRRGCPVEVALGCVLLLFPVSGTRAEGLPASAPEGAPARWDHDRVKAAGTESAILSVSRFGRYAVMVSSKQGVALRIVDRAAGPGPVSGAPGTQDGRVDSFLDRGDFKIVTEGHEKASGEARLTVRPFEESNPARTVLPEGKSVATTLEDFTQRSWWIRNEAWRTVAIEAGGRALADLRLWKDGSWLEDFSPSSEVVEPVPANPLRVLRLSARIGPGLYLLTAYGGAPLPWAEETGTCPLHVRFGIPSLPEAGRSRHEVSPFGEDRYLLPATANFFRVEVPEAVPLALEVGDFQEEDPFASGGSTARIEKDSNPPVAELRLEPREDGTRTVSVTGRAGQPYHLQHFLEQPVYGFRRSGNHWVSSVSTGAPGDAADATAILTRTEPGSEEMEKQVHDARCVELDRKTGWKRRFNLLGPMSLCLHLREAGTYEVLAEGTTAEFRIEPFFVSTPAHYEPPGFEGPGSDWDLDAGYFVLTAQPRKRGILTLGLRPKGVLDTVLGWVGLDRKPEDVAPQPSARFGVLALQGSRTYFLWSNARPEVTTGWVVREAPLDLTAALPLALTPGETVSVPFRAGEPVVLDALVEDGKHLAVSVDGLPPERAPRALPGDHVATVVSQRAETAWVSLSATPARLAADAPFPELPEGALEALPRFPVLSPGEPAFVDLGHEETATFLVRADRAALYRIETTGLLATEGDLRTRTIPSLEKSSGGGTGRNLLIQRYLGEGDYQVTVGTRGESAGHAGVRLTRAPLLDGGELEPGVPARATLVEGKGILYRFAVKKAGDYRLRAFGLTGAYPCRLEDDDGWPVETPDIPADFGSRHFEPGSYRLVLLPRPLSSRVLTLFERVEEPLRFEGHGPHPLPLGVRIAHLWLEPERGADRTPDTWTFEMPARAEAAVTLTGDMQGAILRDPDGARVAAVPPRRGWQGILERGVYRLEARSVRTNNRASYEVAVVPAPLVAGLEREVPVPSEVPVAVGTGGVVEIRSFGGADVRARLLGPDGRLAGMSDDRPDDWNFSLTLPLSPGDYRLRIEAVAGEPASTLVSMRVPVEALEPALAIPARERVRPGGKTHLYPLSLPAGADLLLAAASSGDAVSIAIEESAGSGWRVAGRSTGKTARLEVPLVPDRDYRLRIGSEDRRSTPAELSVAAIPVHRASEGDLARGLTLVPVPGIDPPVAAAAVTLPRPGIFRFEGAGAGTRVAVQPGFAATALPDQPLAATARTLWIVQDAGRRAKGSSPVRAVRVVPEAWAEAALPFRLPAGEDAAVDLPGGKGPVLAIVEAIEGQPGVSLDGVRSPRMAVAPPGAATVSLSGSPGATLVWRADDPSAAMEARLRVFHYPTPDEGRLALGAREGTLEGRSAVSYALPEGAKRIRLALGGSIVAALADGTGIRSVHWAGALPFEETVETDASRLALLHAGEGEDRYTVEALPAETGWTLRPLAAGAPLDRTFTSDGLLRIDVGGTEGSMLRVRGTREAPLFLRADGQVRRGADIALGAGGGSLLLSHGRGPVLAWVDDGRTEGMGLFGEEAIVHVLHVEPPATVPLTGRETHLAFTFEEPVLLRLRSATPVATYARRPDEPAPGRVDLHPGGLSLDLYVPGTLQEVWLRPVGAGSLRGTAEAVALPVQPVGEGLGPATLLPAGGSRLFSFEVHRDGPIGIGVRASRDEVEARLLDANGREVARGNVMMPEVQAGTWLLLLRAPEGGAPVVARPALAGIEPPATGPPLEVVKRYLQAAREGSLAEVSPETGTQAPPAPPGPWWKRHHPSRGSEEPEEGEDQPTEGEEETGD